MATLGEQLSEISGNLSEASAEIVALIEDLQTSPTISAEDQAKLDVIKEQTKGLKDIVPGPDAPTE